MATVFVPIGMRPLTAGQRTVSAQGANVAAVIADLETNYPGFQAALIEQGQLRPGLTIAVNSEEQPLGLLAKVPPTAEVHILPAMAGGAARAREVREQRPVDFPHRSGCLAREGSMSGSGHRPASLRPCRQETSYVADLPIRTFILTNVTMRRFADSWITQEITQ